VSGAIRAAILMSDTAPALAHRAEDLRKRLAAIDDIAAKTRARQAYLLSATGALDARREEDLGLGGRKAPGTGQSRCGDSSRPRDRQPARQRGRGPARIAQFSGEKCAAKTVAQNHPSARAQTIRRARQPATVQDASSGRDQTLARRAAQPRCRNSGAALSAARSRKSRRASP